MSAGSIYVYARMGGDSSVFGSDRDGAPSSGHVFITVRDNRTGEQIDVDVWNGPDGEMVVNDRVSDERRMQHHMVKFDVDAHQIERALDAADNLHIRSDNYELFDFNCTDAVETVLSTVLDNVPDFIFPISVFNWVVQMGQNGDLNGFGIDFSDHVIDPISGLPPDDPLPP